MRRWLVTFSLLLASWQVLGAVRLSEPCCDDPCDAVMACVPVACTACAGCAGSALSATDLRMLPVMPEEDRPQRLGWRQAPEPVGDIWKPPRKMDRFT